jgi:hypothetical protein
MQPHNYNVNHQRNLRNKIRRQQRLFRDLSKTKRTPLLVRRSPRPKGALVKLTSQPLDDLHQLLGSVLHDHGYLWLVGNAIYKVHLTCLALLLRLAQRSK